MLLLNSQTLSDASHMPSIEFTQENLSWTRIAALTYHNSTFYLEYSEKEAFAIEVLCSLIVNPLNMMMSLESLAMFFL